MSSPYLARFENELEPLESDASELRSDLTFFRPRTFPSIPAHLFGEIVSAMSSEFGCMFSALLEPESIDNDRYDADDLLEIDFDLLNNGGSFGTLEEPETE